MFSTSPPSAFDRELQYQNWQANKHSILTVIELGPPMSEFSPKISKYYDLTDFELKFHKAGIEN